MKIFNNKKTFWCLILLVYISFVILNFLTPLLADDFNYIFKTGNIFTVFHDEYLHYLSTNGRSVAHLIVRTLLLMPKFIFNIVNPIVFLIVSGIIYKLTNFSKQKFNTIRLLFIVMLIVLFVPRFGETILWETGSINYLWTFGIMLTFISIYHWKIIKNVSPVMKYASFFMFIFGLIAGWCNENTSGGLILLTISYIFIGWKINNKKVLNWMKFGLLGEFIGFLIMLSSPGNKMRSTFFERSSWPVLKKVLVGIGDVSNALVEHSLILFVLTIIMITICITFYKNRYNYLLALVYLFVGTATCYSLALSPAGFVWGRSYFGGIMYIIIALNMVIPDFNLTGIDKKIVDATYSIIYLYVMLLTVWAFLPAIPDIYHSYTEQNKRYSFIISEREKGNKNPEVPSFDIKTSTSYPAYSTRLSHMGEDTNANHPVADYFHVNTVKAIPMKEWEEKYGKW